MTNITTLGKVAEQVDQLSRNCTDQLIPVKDISFDHLETLRIGSEPHTLRPIAQKSIAWRLGIPIQYLRKCPPDMQAYNMNYWIEREKHPELFLRFDGEDVRALFTPKYKPVDNFEVMERLDSLGYGSDTQVQVHLDPDFMSLSILESNQRFEINGERMTPGISISNSEVGLASLSIAAFILRLICTNGMISKSSVSASYRHVSSKILSEFPDVMTRVGQELGSQRNQFRFSMESKVDNPTMTLESFNRQFQLSKPEKGAVESAWPQESGDRMFNIVQTYTRAANAKDLSAESSHKLQKVGGMILDMVKAPGN